MHGKILLADSFISSMFVTPQVINSKEMRTAHNRLTLSICSLNTDANVH